jgi:hypothetical protein
MPGKPRFSVCLYEYPYRRSRSKRHQPEVEEIRTKLNYFLGFLGAPEWEGVKWEIVKLFPHSRPLRRLDCFQGEQPPWEATPLRTRGLSQRRVRHSRPWPIVDLKTLEEATAKLGEADNQGVNS